MTVARIGGIICPNSLPAYLNIEPAFDRAVPRIQEITFVCGKSMFIGGQQQGKPRNPHGEWLPSRGYRSVIGHGADPRNFSASWVAPKLSRSLWPPSRTRTNFFGAVMSETIRS